jgi:hypothetical protein
MYDTSMLVSEYWPEETQEGWSRGPYIMLVVRGENGRREFSVQHTRITPKSLARMRAQRSGWACSSGGDP